MKKSIMILSAMCLLPLGTAIAGPDCKTKCAKAKATTVAAKDCDKSKCDKATTVAAKDCDKAKCNKATTVAAKDCNFKCEKSVAKLFTAFDKNQDGKLCKGEFMALVKATMGKQDAKATAAN